MPWPGRSHAPSHALEQEGSRNHIPDAGGGPSPPCTFSETALPEKPCGFELAESRKGKKDQHGQHASEASLASFDSNASKSDASKSSSDEDVPEGSELDADLIFARLASEPYETMETVIISNPQSPRDLQEDQLLVRNLDTGEVRRLGEGALSESFVGDNSSFYPASFRPQQKQAAVGQMWQGWWQEKRQRDEYLWKAAESGCAQDVRIALASADDGGPPAEVNSRSLHGRTALHIAASTGQADCVELLLDARARVDQRTDAGLTALHAACQRGHENVARVLLDWDADVCTDDNDGNAPLHVAAAAGHSGVVGLLLEFGCDEQLHHRNRLRQRPVEVALDIDVAVLFQRHEQSIQANDDRYAGRTPFAGSVLLHNARSDAVRRLLHQTRSQELDQHTADAAPEPFEPPRRRRPTFDTPRKPQTTPATAATKDGSFNSKEQPKRFIRLRPNGSGIEQVGPDSFTLVKLLGRGSFGEVFQVNHKQTKNVYAMKILQKSKVARGNLLRYAMTERMVLSYIHHPYVVSLHYAFQTPSHLVLVLQFCPGGNLQQFISQEKRLQEPLARLYDAEILLALSHLHERNIVYRDLKPENVVIDEEGHAMLTDFGLSKEGVASIKGAKSFCGSLAFLAPEILHQRGHGRPVDIYGLGVLLYAMLTGMPPFYHRDRETLFANIRHMRLTVPTYVSPVAASLIEALMEREPSRRLGAARTSDIRGHAFFKVLDFEAVMRREVSAQRLRHDDVSTFTANNDRHPSPVSPIGSPFAGLTGRGQIGAAWQAIIGGSSKPVATSPSTSVPHWEFSAAHGAGERHGVPSR